MRWDYDDEYRDDFSKGVHRDILIVPHATNVTKVSGGPPEITSKIPVFAANGQPTNEFQDVEWVITNDDIVKEKFKYSYSLNPNDNITFSSASSAMVEFTIRNKKEYNPDTNRWELDIPNLQYYSFVDENNNLITGELEGNYIIKVYEYFNGDSDTLIYLGMFRVEEDKAVDNGYNRQITAYDFMMTFREMDIFNWYKHLFTGINKLDNDYVDATNKSGEETTKPDNYDADENWVRKKKSKWTVKDALEDLINNLAAYDMIVYDESGNAMVGMTNTNPTLYGRDYGEGVGYSGLGMPIMLDPELFDKTAQYSIPTDPGEDQFEHYGYMKISELEFMEDPSIMKSGSLSMGKFLEDIGVLAGRYPYIRTDYLEDDNYHDPSLYEKGKNRYNNYEKCILTFKPLPSSKDDKNSNGITKLQPEQTFSNHEIVKGFQHELFTVKDVMIVKVYFNDGNDLEFKKLTKKQREDDKKKSLQTFSFSNNMFCSYLVDESDDEEIKKLIPEYQKIKDKLFGKQKKNGNLKGDALFYDGYLNIKYRNYVPYKLQTFCDPVRDVGDRIQINFEDKITGELSSFYTYILSRDIEGVQKQMDTYSANGQMSNPVFSNYQTSSRYESSIGNNIQLLGYKKISDNTSNTLLSSSVTPSDLVSYLRNVGIRLLDEPLTASAKFCKGGSGGSEVYNYNLIYNNSGWDDYTILHNNDTTNPILIPDEEYEPVPYTAVDDDYTTNVFYANEYYDNINGYGSESSMFIFESNHWIYCGIGDIINGSGCYEYGNVVANIEDFYDGSTQKDIIILKEFTNEHGETYDTEVAYVDAVHKAYSWSVFYAIEDHSDNMVYYDGHGTITYLTENTTIEAKYGTSLIVPYDTDGETDVIYTYIYPGVWKKGFYTIQLPSEPVEFGSDVKPYVELKWEDPDDITDYEPTPATWKGTIIIRKEDSAPKHRWDGEEIIKTTTANKDAYKETAYKDEDIEFGKIYYYGFFPYYKAREEDGHNINFFRYTKVIKVDTTVDTDVPVINNVTSDRNTVTITYNIPKAIQGEYTSIKLYGKKNEVPKCDNTDDVIQDLTFGTTEVIVTNLDFNSEYYFAIVTDQEG